MEDLSWGRWDVNFMKHAEASKKGHHKAPNGSRTIFTIADGPKNRTSKTTANTNNSIRICIKLNKTVDFAVTEI